MSKKRSLEARRRVKANLEVKESGAHRSNLSLSSSITLIVFWFLLFWSCRLFFDYGQLFYRLVGKSILERGSIGSNEWQSFLARAGRPELRKALAGAQEKNTGSSVASGWAWVVDAE